MKKKSSKKYAQFKIPKLGKKHLPCAVVLLLVLYLIFAYNYFYYVQRSADIPWPDNQHIYNFDSSADPGSLYVAVGDSLTYGFGADKYEDGYTYMLASRLAEDRKTARLKDYSYPGFRTDDVIKQLDLIIAEQPQIITVFIGINDAHQILETSDFKANYDYILNKLSSETNAEIYAINLPYLGALAIQLPPYNFYYGNKLKNHNEIIKSLAEKYNVSYIDLYTPTAKKFSRSGPYYSRDSFHPSSSGYKIWGRIIEDAISN